LCWSNDNQEWIVQFIYIGICNASPGRASARSLINVRSDDSQGSPGLKGSSLPAGTLSSAMLSTMANVTEAIGMFRHLVLPESGN